MLVDMTFLKPMPYDGGEGIPGPEGTAHRLVTQELVAMAFRSTSTKKSPGPTAPGSLTIRCVFDRDPDRIIDIIQTHLRLGVHPDQWKAAR